jgi:Fe-S-cluster-containing dehydrogenase component/CRP-like cAMP-binding protein
MAGAQPTGQAAENLALLSRVPFLTEVSHEDLEPLAAHSVVRRYEPGASVVVQGEFGHSMFVLVHGQIAIRARGQDGTQLDLGRLHQPGDFFGEVALLGRGVRSATVIAETPTILLEIEKNRFDLLVRRNESALEELEKYYHARSIATYTRLHRYLGQLDEHALVQLTQGARMKKYGRDDVVSKAGDPATEVMLIKDGVLKMVRTGSDGRLSILAYFNTHDVAGSHDASTRPYDLVALGQAEVIFLSRGAFNKLAMTHPHVFAHFGKDDMHRQSALANAGHTIFNVAQELLQEGVEVESLLVINLDRCVRCGNCVRACHARHQFTRLDRRGPIFRRRRHIQSKQHEHIMIPSSCRHCRDPECMIGCPTGAIHRSPNGDVDINDNCIGCDNCARKCPYGNITMMPVPEEQRKDPSITKRAIKCNLCRGYSYSNCVYECPRGAVLRVDPLRFFDELALVMEAEQVDAIKWQRQQARDVSQGESKQRVKPRSTAFVWISLVFFALAAAGIVGAYLMSPEPRTGGTPWGLGFGIGAAGAILFALFLGARKRMRNFSLGPLEIWTQFHMVIGLLGFLAALAHAGFRITGIFTTLLLLVFAFEILTGVLGQALYMTIPRVLTRIERQGLAKLIEDLLEEEIELSRGIAELTHKSPPEIKALVDGPITRAAGGIRLRFRRTYDPERHPDWVRQHVAFQQIPPRYHDVVDRLIVDVCRLRDVRAQLRLHRGLKHWLVAHIAVAAALFVFLGVHVAAMLVLIL